ncbi:MAG: phenylalanine--tRNA ligase subunit beta [Rhodospirillales bacterium]
MKFTLGWLREHLETDATLDRLTEKLSAIGLEVEQVIDPAAPLAPFRTARVIEAVQHPNADRLRVCRVDAGTGAEIQVVCGAPNARTGMGAVFAPPGAVMPGTGITLKVGEIRGVQSAGMLVSARELALGEDHDGIIEIPADTQPGLPYASWARLDDPVIEIGVTPNRGDALAVRGVARDLAAAGLGRLRPWDAAALHGPRSPIVWKNDFVEGCPWILGRHIGNVRNGPSPEWLARRLLAIGLRPISALVDITNYFTIDLGRPLHVFDADLVSGATMAVRRGVGGESFVALDGDSYEVTDADVVIADASGVISLGGIMGGQSTGVSDATRNVFVECALFDPVRVALTGRRQQLHSDARARFERGVDQSLLPRGLDAATRMIIDLCGGEASDPVSAGAEPNWRRDATLRFERLAGLGGADVAPDAAVGILQRLGFDVRERDAKTVTVAVPPWRNDIAGDTKLDTGGQVEQQRAVQAAEGAALVEPECDLIEEVLRIHGLDHVPAVSLPRLAPVPVPTLTPRQSRAALARRALAARGLAECVTFSFLSGAEAALFGPTPESLRVINPIAADLDQMRPTPVATLVAAALRNDARGYKDGALFEVGPAFSEAGQTLVAAGLRTGATPRHWRAASRPVEALDAKADLWALLAALGVPAEALSTVAEAPDYYHPGRSGVVTQGPKTVLGQFGELHPSVQAKLGLDQPAVAFELFLDRIADPKRRRRAAPELPPLQPVRRDFAFVVPRDLPAETVLRAVRGAERNLIARATLFDVYKGDNVAAGQKSLGVEVVLQPKDRTLTDAEIEAACARIVQAVAKAGGSLR